MSNWDGFFSDYDYYTLPTAETSEADRVREAADKIFKEAMQINVPKLTLGEIAKVQNSWSVPKWRSSHRLFYQVDDAAYQIQRSYERYTEPFSRVSAPADRSWYAGSTEPQCSRLSANAAWVGMAYCACTEHDYWTRAAIIQAALGTWERN